MCVEEESEVRVESSNRANCADIIIIIVYYVLFVMEAVPFPIYAELIN